MQSGITLFWLCSRRLPFWSTSHPPMDPTLGLVEHAVMHGPLVFDDGERSVCVLRMDVRGVGEGRGSRGQHQVSFHT
jgi:hypothetical protein